MALLLGSFLLSCISQVAQHYQMQIDMEESNKLRARLPKNVLAQLTSPTSKRLILPPPTVSKHSSSSSSSSAQPKISMTMMSSPSENQNLSKKKE